MTATVRYFLPLVLIASPAVAGESFDAARRAKTVAPFVDELTRVVARVDLTRVAVEPPLNTLLRLVPEVAVDYEQVRNGLNRLRLVLSQAGAGELYVIVSLADLPDPPWFVVVPAAEGSDFQVLTRQLTNWLEEHGGLKLQTVDRVALIGPSKTLDRIAQVRPQPRPEMSAAFEAAGDATIQLLLLPTDDDRRVIEELVPTLPQQIGGGSSTIVTAGLQWAALGVDLSPQPSLRLVVQSRDAPAARALRERCAEMLPLLKTVDRSGEWHRTAAMLMPEVAGDRLLRELHQKNDGAAALQAVFAPPTEVTLRNVRHYRVLRQLKRIALAMQNWESAHRSMFTQANYDAEGRPLLSWRVHVLRYFGEKETWELYRQFHLDEPWDGPHNRKLIEKMPAVYAIPGSKVGERGRTCFLRPIGEQTSCPGRNDLMFRDITDGTVHTILVVEVDDEHAVVWTRPQDLDYDPSQPAKGLGGHLPDRFYSIFCDGAAHSLELPGDPEQLKALFTRNGGEIVRVND